MKRKIQPSTATASSTVKRVKTKSTTEDALTALKDSAARRRRRQTPEPVKPNTDELECGCPIKRGLGNLFNVGKVSLCVPGLLSAAGNGSFAVHIGNRNVS